MIFALHLLNNTRLMEAPWWCSHLTLPNTPSRESVLTFYFQKELGTSQRHYTQNGHRDHTKNHSTAHLSFLYAQSRKKLFLRLAIIHYQGLHPTFSLSDFCTGSKRRKISWELVISGSSPCFQISQTQKVKLTQETCPKQETKLNSVSW